MGGLRNVRETEAEPRSNVGPAIFASPTFTRRDARRRRWLEIESSGMRAFNAEVFSQRLHVQAYAGPAMLRGVWEHFWEVLPSGALDHLDVFRFHTGTNLVGPWLPGVELWGVVGALLVKRDHLTPAFDAGMDLRIYPHKPLAIRSSAIVSVFEHGPVLLDARAELGVSFGRLEFRTGPRWLYQGELQGFWGPNASLSTRF